MKTKKNSHGGARKGAGKKPMPANEVSVTIRVLREFREQAREEFTKIAVEKYRSLESLQINNSGAELEIIN